MFWILVAAGAAAGGVIGYLLSRRGEKPITTGGCGSKEDDTESGCPLCSAGGVNVIGGGLIDPESTTPEFRERYLNGIREAAQPYLFPAQRKCMKVSAATLGELSQAIGAALAALYTAKAR